ncbi:hypothetical protein C6P40_002833 [Pichia californica]|uniref:Phospholipid/glycerol acyltransferase domain-containing protein n=1 Tax=Pichia californica TaxID=460514 RepID=A0A9P6WR03_9ASCO|nr:hypothetical protein C6P42_004481 [[Candida] californica]KAG0690458.1 hypothetical protein C6P40_002833 [[Candida] californica]
MEKFSSFSDKTTGISPFLPTPLHPTLKTYIFHTILIPIKLFTMIPVLLISPLLTLFPNTYKIIIDVILAYFFNLSETEFAIDGVRRLDEKIKISKSPRNGDIIIVNSTGPLDIFVWKMLSENPKNVKIGIANGDGIGIINNWISFVNWCFTGSLNLPNEAKKNIVHITDIDATSSNVDGVSDLKKFVGENGILYVIVEGTITNNKGILSFPRGFDVGAFAKMAISCNYGFKIMSLKVLPTGISNTVIPTNFWYWIFLNFGSMSMNLKYRIKMTVLFDKYTKNGSENVDPSMITDTLIRTILANNSRLKLLSSEMDVKKKREYIQAVLDSREKKYV